MKRLAMAAMLAALVSVPALADPLEGNWLTAPDDNGNSGMIEVTPCGGGLCGTLTRAFDPAGKEVQSPQVGRRIIWDTVPKGGGEYRGKVYAPDRDKTYNSKLILSGDNLSVSGCVLGICREGGVWRRQQ
ncbi:DUF2147 domain-containing protein [Pseudoruegeria sp. HB172150]|uniref:DUF2147 domain-containing protein n=1 Tax=Pseudoruegeria sp. HB172150 TaxID=2721164 RepID=UPI00155342DF|nr:DUF2147 domain-containing protein [Pseudoruegeria sp. HB172150]